MCISQKPKWDFVMDNVGHLNTAIYLFKMMLVMPE